MNMTPLVQIQDIIAHLCHVYSAYSIMVAIVVDAFVWFTQYVPNAH